MVKPDYQDMLCMSVAKKDVQHTYVLLTGTAKSTFSTLQISSNWTNFHLSNLHILCPPYTYQI